MNGQTGETYFDSCSPASHICGEGHQHNCESCVGSYHGGRSGCGNDCESDCKSDCCESDGVHPADSTGDPLRCPGEGTDSLNGYGGAWGSGP